MFRLFKQFSTMIKLSIISLMIFLCFNTLFLVKNKNFILTGSIQSSSSVKLTINTAEKATVYSASFFKQLDQIGQFKITLHANKLERLRLFIEAQTTDPIEINDLKIVGNKDFSLNFKAAQITGTENYEIGTKDNSIVLSMPQNYAIIEFHKFTPLKAKRTYKLTLFSVFCLLPFLWCLLPLKCKEFFKIWGIFILPLLLLGIIKYFAFEHPYTLFYHKLSLSNLFQLEKYEFPIFSLVYGLLAIFLYLKNKWLRRLLGVLLWSLMSILIIDGVVLHNLNSRFVFAEALDYKSEYSAAFFMLLSYLGTIQGRFMFLLCCVLAYILNHHFQFQKAKFRYFSLFLSIGLVLIAFLFKTDFIFADRFLNVFQANQGQNQSRHYTAEFSKNLKSSFKIEQNCVSGLNKQKNVIVVIAESLSTFSSNKLSHLNNYIPRLDKIMDEHAVWMDYYSNAYNTTTGIFTLLSGLPAIHDYTSFGKTNNPILYKESLPQKLQRGGYYTSFLTSVEMNEPLRNIVDLAHFDEVSDFRDSFYGDKPRIIFNAPADEYLFANALMQIRHKNFTQPYLMVISTISGHGPYIDPRSKEQSFAKVNDYVDEELFKFVETLKKEGFFKNGMMLITGDHRAMLPVSSKELQTLGSLAEGRVPLIVLDNEIKGKHQGVYSHNDIAPSLQYYLTQQGCFNQFQNNLFVNNQKENCILYQKSMPRDEVDLLCTNQQTAICLNGDDTAYCQNVAAQKYIDFVNWLRISEEEFK